MKPVRILVTAALAAGSLVLAGCGGGVSGADDGDAKVRIVASTNVYGQIAQEIGGDAVEVVSIVDSAAQDPHSYEPSAQDQLSVSRADLVLDNGGGYDAFVDALVESSGSSAPVLTAATFSHDWPGEDDHSGEPASPEPAASETADGHGHDHADESADEHAGHGHIEGFNEHVWYDPHTVEAFAEAIADELSTLRPDAAATFAANAAAFVQGVGGLEDALDQIAAAHAGAEVFVTEPLPLYLTTAAGLTNVTPSAFSEGVEEGQDVPPATLLEAVRLIDAGSVKVLIRNAQTGGAETTQVVDKAQARGIPVVEFAETLPEGQTYLSWMQENIAALSAALA